MLTSFVLFLPIIGGLLLTLFPGSRVSKWQALILSCVAAGASISMLTGFDPNAGKQFGIQLQWLPTLGVDFHVGVDGIGLVLLLLNNLLCPIIILSTFKQTRDHEGLFYGLLLVMQGAMTGVFVSYDLFLYYIFWELALIPAYFLVLLWGTGERSRTAMKFFLYTLVGSLLMLVGIIYLGVQQETPSFELAVLQSVQLSPSASVLVMLGFMLAYAIKIPVFPFHTWQPDTYVQAPTAGTMMMSGIMLKMGLFSIIRWVLPLMPDALFAHSSWMIWLIVIGIAYASVIAIQQKDLKRLFAYASIAHVGLIAAGILTQRADGITGAVLQMVAHGVNAVGLFYICQVLMERRGTNDIASLGGLRQIAPWFATAYFIVLLGTVALPLTNGFPGEFMLLSSLFERYWPWALVAGTGVILGAVYMLKSYQESMLGAPSKADFADLDGIDKLVFLPILAAIILLGLLPNAIVHLVQPTIEALVRY